MISPGSMCSCAAACGAVAGGGGFGASRLRCFAASVLRGFGAARQSLGRGAGIRAGQHSAGCIPSCDSRNFDTLEWRNWQTRWTQNPVGVKTRAGSTPASSTTKDRPLNRERSFSLLSPAIISGFISSAPTRIRVRIQGSDTHAVYCFRSWWSYTRYCHAARNGTFSWSSVDCRW